MFTVLGITGADKKRAVGKLIPAAFLLVVDTQKREAYHWHVVIINITVPPSLGVHLRDETLVLADEAAQLYYTHFIMAEFLYLARAY